MTSKHCVSELLGVHFKLKPSCIQLWSFNYLTATDEDLIGNSMETVDVMRSIPNWFKSQEVATKNVRLIQLL